MSKQTANVLCEVAAERERQDCRWGEQNHPDGTGPWKVVRGHEVRRDEVVAEVRTGRAEEDRRGAQQQQRGGVMAARPAVARCKAPGCDRAHHCKGLCVAHYMRTRRGSDPSYPVGSRGGVHRARADREDRGVRAHRAP